MAEEQRFGIDWPSGYQPGDWIGVRSGWPTPIEHPFEIRLRYSKKGELLCAGLRIQEHASNLYREPCPLDKRAITRRMLVNLPLGAVLRFIAESRVSDPAVREHLERLRLPLGLPAEGLRVRPGPKGRPDNYYIRMAVLFARYCRDDPRTAAKAYRCIAAEKNYEESVVRRQVRRGWDLAKKRGWNLKPEGIRTRRAKREET